MDLGEKIPLDSSSSLTSGSHSFTCLPVPGIVDRTVLYLQFIVLFPDEGRNDGCDSMFLEG